MPLVWFITACLHTFWRRLVWDFTFDIDMHLGGSGFGSRVREDE